MVLLLQQEQKNEEDGREEKVMKWNEILSLVNRESVRNDFLMTKLGVKK